MIVYTVAVWNRSICKDRAILFLDTTVKSGDPAFAPSWDIVMKHKASTKSPADDQAYRDVYWPMMRRSYLHNRDRWDWLMSQESIALGCYCPPGQFCHRHELVTMIEQVAKARGTPFEYGGELLPDPKRSPV